MAVVAACVHHTVDGGGDHPSLAPLADGQRIHVGAEHQRRSGLSAVEIGEHSGPADAGANREAEVGASPRNQHRGVLLLERQLGVRMQQPPGLRDLLTGPVDLGADARVEIDGDVTHDSPAALTPERRSATS